MFLRSVTVCLLFYVSTILVKVKAACFILLAPVFFWTFVWWMFLTLRRKLAEINPILLTSRPWTARKCLESKISAPNRKKFYFLCTSILDETSPQSSLVSSRVNITPSPYSCEMFFGSCSKSCVILLFESPNQAHQTHSSGILFLNKRNWLCLKVRTNWQKTSKHFDWRATKAKDPIVKEPLFNPPTNRAPPSLAFFSDPLILSVAFGENRLH